MLELITLPNCSICEEAKAWLQGKNVDFKERNIYKEPLMPDDIHEIASIANVRPIDLIRQEEEIDTDPMVDFDLEGRSEHEVAEALALKPRAMALPLLSNGKQIVIGFKPEEMEALIRSL